MTGEFNKDNFSARDAKRFLKEVLRALNSSSSDIPADARKRIESLSKQLRQAISENNSSVMYKRYLALRALVNEHVEFVPKSTAREYAEAISVAILVALFLRGFIFEAFQIPTGSMIPTLEIGDHLFVNKFVYGIRIPFTDRYVVHFAKPKAGEVVVFTFPTEEAKAYLSKQPHAKSACIDLKKMKGKVDFIKRIVGVEGDTVEMRNNHLYVNGVPFKYTKAEPPLNKQSDYIYPMDMEREINNGQVYTIQYAGRDRDFGPVKVADGHVFVMGDNRDHSADSRCWGQVPVENIKGRAMFIWASFYNNSIGSIHLDRAGQSIHESVGG